MNTKIFNETFKLAQAVEPVRGARIAAAVVHRGKIISYGFNHKKSHPFQSPGVNQPTTPPHRRAEVGPAF